MSAETASPLRRLAGRGVAKRDREDRSDRSVRTAAGIVALVAAAALTVAFGTTPLSIVLAGLSVVLLAGHPTLGPLGAAAIVILTLPYDRAANGYLPRVASIPIRPQDLAVALGLALSLPAVHLKRPTRSLPGGLLIVFIGIGLAAVVSGVVGANDARDIVRDARWWFLYGAGVLVMFLPAPTRAQVLRGVLLGALGFATVILVTAVLPAMAGGIKARAQEFDFGLLRLQYGNSVFLLIPLAWGAFAWIRGQRWAMAALVLASLAVMLSLTRMLMLISVGIILLAALASIVDVYRRRRGGARLWPVARIAAAIAVLPITFTVALTIISATPTTTPTTAPTTTPTTAPTTTPTTAPTTTPTTTAAATPRPVRGAPTPEDPFGRVIFENGQSGWESIVGGRLKTYGRAIMVIAADPLIGSGMGATVVAEYQFGGEKFATPGRLPNVDNAYLTAGMKGGVAAMVVLLGLLAWPAVRGVRFLRGRISRIWWLPAWLGILALTMTQSFATTGYGPFLLGLLVVVLGRGYASMSVRRAAAQE